VIALGCDPGFACTGWGVVERVGATHFLRSQGTIRTSPADGDTATRLVTIWRELLRVVDRWDPNIVGVEDVELRPRQAKAEHVSQDGLLQTAKVVGIACVCAPAARVVLLRNCDWRSALGIRKAEDVRERLTWMLGDLGGSVHSRDAAGIALAALGRADVAPTEAA
jgi:Holliday junction resolvasome RuvABC endonuclease subunit